MEIRIDDQYLNVTGAREIAISWNPATSEALVLAETGKRVMGHVIISEGPMIKVQIPSWLTQILPVVSGDKWQHATTTPAEFQRAYCGLAIGDHVSYRYSNSAFEITDILTSAAAGGFAAMVRRVRNDGEYGIERKMYFSDLVRLI